MNKSILVLFALPLFYNCGGEETTNPTEVDKDTALVVEEIEEVPEVVNSFVITQTVSAQEAVETQKEYIEKIVITG